MISNIKFISGIAVFIAISVLSYKMGQLAPPMNSIESAYEIVKDLNKDIVHSFELQNKANLSYSYIPAYSHIYSSEGEPLNMAITLSLRNIDLKSSISIEQILFYNTEGQLIRKYLKEKTVLEPLATKEIFIKRSDIEGGSGANFVVLFKSDKSILPPIFEAIMIGAQRGESYMFKSRGVIYSDKSNN